jgi:hypothetical protein
MARRTKFTGDYRGIGQMLTSQDMQAAMRELAQPVRQQAEDKAPVGDPRTDPHSGRYKASFYVDSGVQRHKTARAYAEIGNTAPEAVDVEYGGSQDGGRHTLLTALSMIRE